MTEYLSIETIFTEWEDGDGIGWDASAEWLEEHDWNNTHTLKRDIEQNGITTPVLLGDDGRVWDGHHRIYCAWVLGIKMIPVTYASDLGD